MRWMCAMVLAGAGLLLPGAGAANESAKDPAASVVQNPSPPSPTPAEEAKIEGFRAATFGMTEAQVRQAIKKDFPGPAEKIASEVHPTEKTGVLSIQVPDLIPGAGRAKVTYIMGHTTKKLIQVNATWTADAKSPAAEGVVAAANVLRNHFLSAGYQPNSILANHQLPNGYVVFRGLDAGGRMVMLMLAGATGTDADKDKDKAAPPPPITLQLSYVLDPQSPDVFRVTKGMF